MFGKPEADERERRRKEEERKQRPFEAMDPSSGGEGGGIEMQRYTPLPGDDRRTPLEDLETESKIRKIPGASTIIEAAGSTDRLITNWR